MANDDWQEIQIDLRDGVYGDWNEIRQNICEGLSLLHPGHGISSSDINHVAYGMVTGGDLTKVER
jgi:hypothetical protein